MNPETNFRFDDGKWTRVSLSSAEIQEISSKLAKVLAREIRKIRRQGRGTGSEELRAVCETACRQVGSAIFQDSLEQASRTVQRWPKWKREVLGSFT